MIPGLGCGILMTQLQVVDLILQFVEMTHNRLKIKFPLNFFSIILGASQKDCHLQFIDSYKAWTKNPTQQR